MITVRELRAIADDCDFYLYDENNNMLYNDHKRRWYDLPPLEETEYIDYKVEYFYPSECKLSIYIKK